MTERSTREDPDPRDPDMLYLNIDLLGGVVVAVFGLVGLLAAEPGAFNVWVFPRFNSWVILLMSAGMIAQGVIRKHTVPVISKTNGRRLVVPMSVGLVAFYFLFTRLGWNLTVTMVFGVAFFMLRSRRTWLTALTSLAVAAGVALFFYYVFGNVFYVPWPTGTWIEALFGA